MDTHVPDGIVLSAKGATVTSWRAAGKDIFFPPTEFSIGGETKVRGGMHPCFPNFGPVRADFGLPQHGPLRNTMGKYWQEGPLQHVQFEQDDLVVPKQSCRVSVCVRPMARGCGFSYELEARLLGLTGKARVNPGLHPYFSTPEQRAAIHRPGKEPVYIVGMQSPARIVPLTPYLDIEISGVGKVRLEPGGDFVSTASARWVIWRDRLDYLCVEPVLGSHTVFEDDRQCAYLGPHRQLRVSCTFKLL